MSIKTELFKKLPDMISRQRELIKQGVTQFSSRYSQEEEDETPMWSLSYPFTEEELGPEGPDGGMSPALEMRKAA